MIFVCRGRLPTPCAHFIHFCARRCSETYILTFWMARRCSETHILILPDEPSRRIRWVDRAKLWRNVNFELLESLRALAWACQRLCFVSARWLRALCLLSQSFGHGRPRKFASRIGRWPWKQEVLGPIPGSDVEYCFSLCFLSAFSLCVSSLCFLSVFSLCVFSLCVFSVCVFCPCFLCGFFLSVFSVCVFSLCFLSMCGFCVFSLCVFSLCFLSVFSVCVFSVFSLCFLSVFSVCVFSVCFLSVFVFSVCFLSVQNTVREDQAGMCHRP